MPCVASCAAETGISGLVDVVVVHCSVQCSARTEIFFHATQRVDNLPRYLLRGDSELLAALGGLLLLGLL